jgi:hypothetical protein
MTGNSSPALRRSRRPRTSFRYGTTGDRGLQQRGVTSVRTRVQSSGCTGPRRTRRFRVSAAARCFLSLSPCNVLQCCLLACRCYPMCLLPYLPACGMSVSPSPLILRLSTALMRCRLLVFKFIPGNDRRAGGLPRHLENVHLRRSQPMTRSPMTRSHRSSWLCSLAQANTTLQADGHARSVPAPWRTSPRRLLPSSHRCLYRLSPPGASCDDERGARRWSSG